MEVNGCCKLSGNQHSSKYRRFLIDNFHFRVNGPFCHIMKVCSFTSNCQFVATNTLIVCDIH